MDLEITWGVDAMELLNNQMSCMMIRFGEKGHKDFQPERKWEIPWQEHHVQQKAYEFSHGHDFETSMWW